MAENKFFEKANTEATSPPAEGREEKEGTEEEKAGEEKEEERVLSPEEMEAELAEERSYLAKLKENAEILKMRIKKARGHGEKRAALRDDLRLVEEQIGELEGFIGEIDSDEFELEEISMKPHKEEEKSPESSES